MSKQVIPTATDRENKIKRLRFRSWHRGTREMDLIMGSFADANLDALSDEELESYEEVLSYSDPDLYNWVTGKEEVPANLRSSTLDKLLEHEYKAIT